MPKGLEYPVVDVLPNVDGNCVVVKLELLEKKGSSSKDELNDGVIIVSSGSLMSVSARIFRPSASITIGEDVCVITFLNNVLFLPKPQPIKTTEKSFIDLKPSCVER